MLQDCIKCGNPISVYTCKHCGYKQDLKTEDV